jgi:hypothetical protein
MSSKPKIKGNIQDLNKKTKNEKLKQTNYLLTINTNCQYKDGDKHLDDDIEIFNESINDLLNHIDSYVRLPETDKWNDDFIKNCDIDYTIERGTIKNQLHIHIMIKIRHNTKIQLDYEKIKNKICSDLGLKNVYMYNRLLKPSQSENIIDYINKYV